MDLLKEYAHKNRLTRKERSIRLFHAIFLGNIKYFGRIHELGFMAMWKVFSGQWFSDIPLGIKMFSKGKLSLKPDKIKKKKELKKLFKVKVVETE
jgi:hypothetical protein